MDLTSIPDSEFRQELERRSRAREKADQERRHQEYLRVLEEKEAKDKEFAAGIGITWEQFQSADDYIRDKVYEEQR